MNRDFNNELNTDLKNAFGHIHAENALKERTKDYLSQKIYNTLPVGKQDFLFISSEKRLFSGTLLL